MSQPRPAPPLRRRSAPERPRVAAAAHWKAAAWLMRAMFALFGNPEDVAFAHTITREARALMLAWLRAGETMLRRLLLIEAAAYAKPNMRTPRATRTRRKRELIGFEPHAPQDWRVSFRVLGHSSPVYGGSGREAAEWGRHHASPLPLATLGTSPASGGRGEPRRFFSAWPLAERYEALLRAFNEPALYAQRLARRLHASPYRAHVFADARPLEVAREEIAAMQKDVETAARRFNSS